MTKAAEVTKDELVSDAAVSEAAAESPPAAPKKKATRKSKAREEAVEVSVEAIQAARSERALGRAIAFGLPALTLVVAIGVGVLTSAGPAILILISGVLLGAIALFWASLRTLGGDAPLPEGMDRLDARRFLVSANDEKRRTVLRALKDLEHEHAIGKIDDEDYAEIVQGYRAQAKGLMRDMDAEVAPLRDKAERVARTYLERRGILGNEPHEAEDAPEEAPSRIDCSKCGAVNDDDAAFCKKCGTAIPSGETKGNGNASA